MSHMHLALQDEDVNAAQVLDSLLQERYSCRAYQSQAVPQPVIEQILGMAQRTASWCNTQPWHVVITSGAGTSRFSQALIKQASEADPQTDFPFPREYTGEYLARRRECGGQLYDSVGIDRRDRQARADQAQRNFLFFDAPHVAIVASPEPLGVYGAIDCGAYVNNFMLAAKSCGIASVAQAALALHSPFIREFLGLDDHWRIVCGISFGYADESHPVNQFRTSRASIHDHVSWVSG